MLDDTQPAQRPVFTPILLRDIVGGFLTDRFTPPGLADLEPLARALNRIRGAYTFADTTANASKPAADKVRAAIETLTLFFEERKQFCASARGIAAQVIRDEEHLYNQFNNFAEALRAHDFQLDIDAGLLMPTLDGWRPIAEFIASAFIAAMERNNRGKKLGRSNDGPVAEFTSRVIPLITGEAPSVGNVARQLKINAAGSRRGTI